MGVAITLLLVVIVRDLAMEIKASAKMEWWAMGVDQEVVGVGPTQLALIHPSQ